MTKETLFETLKAEFRKVLEKHHIGNEQVEISCRALSAKEAIGETRRKDFPIITGKDVMIQAEFRGGFGQAFTDAPAVRSCTLKEVFETDLIHDAHSRGVFVATLNAVMNHLGYCTGTVHCRTEGPEQCACDMHAYLRSNYPQAQRIGLIGYQPALLDMLSHSEYEVRVLDLNPANIGQERYGVPVEDGAKAQKSVIDWADMILCTGSTLCNGTIVDYLDIGKEVLFFGITIAGSAPLLGVKRVCFADKYV